jgi:hypothetical protein
MNIHNLHSSWPSRAGCKFVRASTDKLEVLARCSIVATNERPYCLVLPLMVRLLKTQGSVGAGHAMKTLGIVIQHIVMA